jgi:lysozyme
MKSRLVRILFALQLSSTCAFAGNAVVNMSHYDLMRPDFVAMKKEGIVGVIHEASYPRFERDAYYRDRHAAASRAGLLWGAYHFADATDPVKQADHFLRVVANSFPSSDPNGVLLILDFEKNGHYPGGNMRVDQAVAFAERIRERTGKYPGVYMSEYRIRQMLYGPKAQPSDRQRLAECWLWVANYHFEPRNVAPWQRWHMWQYTGDGKCDLRPRSRYPIGIANVRKAERNIFPGSNANLESFWQVHAWRPQ